MVRLGIGLNNMSNFIHPSAIVEPSVVMGDNNYIGPFCYVRGNTNIGNGNRFEAYCSIGAPPEHTNMFTYTGGKTSIGDNNIFREYSSVHSGTTRTTSIGNQNIFLHGSHVSHDSIVEDFVNFAANVVLGGYCYVMEGSNLGIGVVCHQHSKIGAYSMIGMGAVITKKTQIEPAGVYFGVPARYFEYNHRGLSKHDVSENRLKFLIDKYNSI